LTDVAPAPAVAPPPFPYKTQPLPKQREALKLSATRRFFALHMEQGTGKSFVCVITAALLWMRGLIDGVIILAPNGVHQGWILDQFPEHCPETVPWQGLIWQSGEQLKAWRRSAKLRPSERTWDVGDLARDRSKLAILAVNTEAATTPMARKAIGTFLTNRRCLFIADEAGDFTTPSAKRTRALMGWGPRAAYRRILEGVPVSSEPFELYSPFRFLDWRILGYRTYQDMKNAHAEWEEFVRGGDSDDLTAEERRKRTFRVVKVDRETGKKMWKDLDVLARRIAPHTFRCTKREALPDLPPKIFHKRYFELTAEQWRMTMELREEFTTSFADGATVTAVHILTQYLRYQQIACGYVPPDQVYGEETEPVRLIDGPNPRLEMALEEAARHRRVPQIIWARFQMDIDLLKYRLTEDGFRVFTYDGRTGEEERAEVRRRFQVGARPGEVVLGNPKAGGRGLQLYLAEHAMYYSNYFGLRPRLQSEDRNHRIGTKNVVNYTDLLGRGSIDHTIVRALRNQQDVADVITGDPAKDWL
jgi:hypothetical protein